MAAQTGIRLWRKLWSGAAASRGLEKPEGQRDVLLEVDMGDNEAQKPNEAKIPPEKPTRDEVRKPEVESEDVGTLLDSLARLLSDRTVAVKAACALEAWATARATARAGKAESSYDKCLAELIRRFADVATGMAAQPVKSKGCPGSLRAQFFATDDDVWTEFEAQVCLVGPDGLVGVERVHRHKREAHFPNLLHGRSYYLSVSTGQDFSIEQTYPPVSAETARKEGLIEPSGCESREEAPPSPIPVAQDTLIKFTVTYKPRKLDVLAYQEEGGGPVRGQKLECVPITLFHEGREVSSDITGKDGHVKEHFTLDRAGSYHVEAPDRIKINERLFMLAHPGRIAVLTEPGGFTPTVIPIGYTLAGGVIRISPNLEGLPAVNVPAALAGQVEFALFRDRDPSFVQTATADGKSEICWDGLPEGVYTVVVKAASSIQMVEPAHGAFRVSLGPGQDANVSRFVRLRSRPDPSSINEITGTVTDEQGRPLMNCLLEVLVAATQTIHITSFSDANGQYVFCTDMDPVRLAIRAKGQSTQLLGQAQGAAASTGLAPAPASPPAVFPAYPLITTPAAVSS